MAHLAGTSASALAGSSRSASALVRRAFGSAPRSFCSSSVRAQASPAASSSLSTALLLSRPPTILREPSAFEAAYFTYNAKVARALAQPFPKDFYFQKGSAAEQRFDDEEKARAAALAPQTHAEAGKGGNAKAEPPQPSAPTTTTSEHEADLYATSPRRTEADEHNDTTSLQRALDKTLFLLIKDTQGRWRFPTTPLRGDEEPLHRVAPRAVHEPLGEDMDIWLVSNLPIAVLPSGAEKVSISTAQT
jgi:large subunit ribosomal protein L46